MLRASLRFTFAATSVAFSRRAHELDLVLSVPTAVRALPSGLRLCGLAHGLVVLAALTLLLQSPAWARGGGLSPGEKAGTAAEEAS
jgi:hypothetical protein